LRIPNAQKEQTSTSQLEQKHTEPDVTVDKMLYQQFGGSKIDSQRSAVVPQAAGFRQRKLSTGKPTDESRKDEQTPNRIRNANVEEFLGDYNTKPHLLHPSFKTSKIILQVKGNSNNNTKMAGKMKDQGVDNRSVCSSAYGRDMSNQVAMNTMTTFANLTGKSQIHGRRSSNESREPSQNSQNAITKSIYGHQSQ